MTPEPTPTRSIKSPLPLDELAREQALVEIVHRDGSTSFGTLVIATDRCIWVSGLQTWSISESGQKNLLAVGPEPNGFAATERLSLEGIRSIQPVWPDNPTSLNTAAFERRPQDTDFS